MLLETLLVGVSCQLRICVLLCRNETYRKVAERLFYMSHREIFMRRRLFRKWRRLFEKSRLRFGKSRRHFLSGSTCSIFGSTSERSICTRKRHDISQLSLPVALVALSLARNIRARRKVKDKSWRPAHSAVPKSCCCCSTSCKALRRSSSVIMLTGVLVPWCAGASRWVVVLTSW